jgi:hypothetical protein
MRHGHEIGLVVIDAKDVVALKVEVVDIALDLLITRGEAKPKITVSWWQREQVRGYLRSVVLPERGNTYKLTKKIP